MKKNNHIILIIIVVILLIILGILYFSNNETEINNDQQNIVKTDIKLLDDYSRFYTVDSCIYKYINFITSNKVDDLLNVLDKDYKNKKNITKNTIFNYINKLEGIYSFKSKKMYYEKIDNNYIKYYVYGYLIKEEIDGMGEYQDYYLIVNLDLENNLFSITPYDGEIFKEETK